MLTFLLIFAAASIVVVSVQFSCYFSHKQPKKQAPAASIPTCSEA